MLVEKASETTIFALVTFDLDLKILSLLGKLLGERLEFEKLDGL